MADRGHFGHLCRHLRENSPIWLNRPRRLRWRSQISDWSWFEKVQDGRQQKRRPVSRHMWRHLRKISLIWLNRPRRLQWRSQISDWLRFEKNLNDGVLQPVTRTETETETENLKLRHCAPYHELHFSSLIRIDKSDIDRAMDVNVSSYHLNMMIVGKFQSFAVTKSLTSSTSTRRRLTQLGEYYP